MKRTLALVAMGLLIPIAALVAGPEVPWIPEKTLDLTPFGALRRTAQCQPGGQTVALAWGNRGTALGVYVYGPDGQCIGSDDAFGERLDERIVSFTPIEAGPYEMVVRSFSNRTNPVQPSFRQSGRDQ